MKTNILICIGIIGIVANISCSNNRVKTTVTSERMMNSKSVPPTLPGYYYSIAYNSSKDHVAQFSTVYYSNCSEDKLKESLDKYVIANHFETARNEGPYNTESEAESKRQDAKKQWNSSGYLIGGDNNFFGDCKE